MNDEQLIELVRQYPVLYDLSHSKYMDTTSKLNIWHKIGKETKADVSSCKARWNNIRDNYRKSLKKTKTRTGEAAKKIKLYKYSEQLNFLKKYFNERETKGNIESQEEEEDNQDHNGQDEEEVENEKDDAGEPSVSGIEEGSESAKEMQSQPSSILNRKNTVETPTKSKIRKTETNKGAPQETASAKLLEYIIHKNENRATTPPQHAVDAFLAGVAPTLKTFNPYYLNLAKSEIFATVQKYEMKMFMEQHSYQHYSSTPSPGSTPLLSHAESFLGQEHTVTQNSTDNALQN